MEETITQQPPEQAEWIPSRKAAALLKVTPTAVQQMVRKERIRGEKRFDAITKRTVLMVPAVDVEKIAYEWQQRSENPAKADNVSRVPAVREAEKPEKLAQLSTVREPGALQAIAVADALDVFINRIAERIQPRREDTALLTLQQAADYWKVSTRTVRSLARFHGLPHIIDEPVKEPGEKRARPGASLRFDPAAMKQYMLTGQRPHSDKAQTYSGNGSEVS